MAEKTRISWTHHTFNPWWGCVKVSPACTNCYAERDAKRYGHDVWGPESERRFFGSEHWAQPLKWNKKAAEAGERRRVFCASMADVFERHPIESIDQQLRAERRHLINTIVATPHLDWLLLTKRPENIAEMFTDNFEEPLANVWLGVTAENQEWLTKRARILCKLPARVRFISYEPSLGPLDFAACTMPDGTRFNPLTVVDDIYPIDGHVGPVHWLIAGGESGAGFREGELAWYRSARDQCVAAGAAFFFKQYSGLHPKQLGDLLDGQQWHQVPKA